MTKQVEGTKNPMMLRRFGIAAAVLLLFALVFAAPAAAADGNFAKIGEQEYATLADALKATDEMTGEVTIILLGDVVWETGAAYDSTPLVSESSKAIVTIDGSGLYTLTATGAGIGEIRAANGEMLTFQNMKIVDNSVSYAEGNWEFLYLEFSGNITCDNVQFQNGIRMVGDTSIFTGCSFAGASSEYGIWVSDGDATFNDCMFSSYRGLKMHEQYGSEVNSVSVDNCRFEFTNAEKPGIVIGNLDTTTIVKITNSVFDGVSAGDQSQYSYESDTDVSTFNFERSGNTFKNLDLTSAENLNEGTYDKDVSSDVAAGYASVKNTDGTWTIKPVYTITFNANGGVGTMDDLSVPEGDTTTPLTSNSFTKDGHVFAGWNTAADGSGDAYADEATTKPTETTTLYAQWTPIYTIKWNLADGKSVETAVVSGTIPTYTGTVPTKADSEDGKYSYTFKGWTPELVAAKENTEYTAVFEEIEIPQSEDEPAPIQPVVQVQATLDKETDTTTIAATVESAAITVTGNTAKINDATESVTLTVTFKETPVTEDKTVSGKVTNVEAEYKPVETAAASGAGEITQQLTINLGNVITELPKIVSDFKQDVKEKAVEHDNEFIPLAMITAVQTGDTTLADINSNLTSTKGVKIVFTVEKGVVDKYGKDNIHIIHVKGTESETLSPAVILNTAGTHYEITVYGNSFSSYVLGVKETVKESTGSSSQGSSVWLQEIPTQTPTQTPTATQTPDVAPTDIPSTQPTATETAKSPGFGVLAVLAGLGAVAVLRRK